MTDTPMTRVRRCACALLAGLFALSAPAGAQVRLPAMGEAASAGMPLGEERRLGDRVAIEVHRDPSYLDDPILTEYMRGLWRPLLRAAQQRGEIGADMQQQFAWELFLIRDRSINAFALPGGFVGVHLGLIAATATRDELVSVMAHELSHVTQRHIARSIESSGRQSALGVATMLLGMIAAARSSNVDVARAAIAGGQAAMIQGQLNFSRDMEREADRMGQTLMGEAGFDMAGMPAMFDLLDKANRLSDAGAFPYLRSHPLTIERIAESQTRAGVDRVAQTRSDVEHELMRARARVLMDPAAGALRAHVQALQQPPAGRVLSPAGTAYAAALAGVQLQDAAATRAGLQALSTAWAGQTGSKRWLDLLQVEAALALPGVNSPSGGVALPAGPPPRVDAWTRPELLLWGRVVLERPSEAQTRQIARRDIHQTLRSWLVTNPGDAPLWELLARYEEANGNRLAMLRATAEASAASGQIESALVTLQSARSQARRTTGLDGMELAVIDTRLAELRRQRMQREGRETRDGRDGRSERGD